MLDLKRRERRFSCIKWQVFLRSIKMQKGISKFSADVESLPGEAASCRLALLSRGGMERLIWLKILPHTSRFLYGRETVLPCAAASLALAVFRARKRLPAGSLEILEGISERTSLRFSWR